MDPFSGLDPTPTGPVVSPEPTEGPQLRGPDSHLSIAASFWMRKATSNSLVSGGHLTPPVSGEGRMGS